MPEYISLPIIAFLAIIIVCILVIGTNKKNGLGFSISFFNHNKIKIKGDTNMELLLHLDEELIVQLIPRDAERNELGVEPGSQVISESNAGDDGIATVVKGSKEDPNDDNFVKIKANALGEIDKDVVCDGKGGDVVNQTLHMHIRVIASDATEVIGKEVDRYKSEPPATENGSTATAPAQ